VALRGLEIAMYAMHPEIKPTLYSVILGTGLVSLAVMAAYWRGVLVRRTLSLRALARIDLAYTLSCGLVFGATAILAWDRHESAYTCLIYACFVVFMRAIVVPSTAAWTAIVSTCTFAPLVIAAGVLAATTVQAVPGHAYFTCATLYTAMAIAIATAGSRFIYGLRRRAREHARLGQYVLADKLHDGAAGAVYRAHHVLLRRPTALKLVRASHAGLARLERAVQATSQLTHPNTVAVYDYGHSLDGDFYYVMELLDGIDLERLASDHGPQPPGRVRDILVQVCGALHEAHLRGLAHRDLARADIILCERGGTSDVAKVTDFDRDADPGANVAALAAIGRSLLAADAAPALEACLASPPTTAAALARALRSADAGDWSPEAARAWWRSFRRDAGDRAATASEIRVTVDLDERAGR
jgi:serine/threonine-protein kinase